MGRVSNRQKIHDKINGALTVEELIKHLKCLPPNALVGKVGHFGEFNEMARCDFHLAKGYITASDSWRDENRKEVSVLNICCPDIGDDPD